MLEVGFASTCSSATTSGTRADCGILDILHRRLSSVLSLSSFMSPKMRWPSFYLRPLSPPVFWTTLSLERCSIGGVIAQCIIQIGTLWEVKYGLWKNQLDAVTTGACEDCPRKLGCGHPARRDLFPFWCLQSDF